MKRDFNETLLTEYICIYLISSLSSNFEIAQVQVQRQRYGILYLVYHQLIVVRATHVILR